MSSRCFSLVRGRVMRVTRLDSCGRVKAGPCSSIVSEGFVSIAATANTEAGTAITVTNANDKQCVRDVPPDKPAGFTLVVTFCEVDPELYAMMTGQPVVYDVFGQAVGFRVNSDVDARDSGFALEVWSTVPSESCGTGVTKSYGYLLYPFVQGGVLGDTTIENGAVSFVLQSAITKKGSGWGKGPYNVVDSGTPVNEVQTLTVVATGGTYTLTYDGSTTTALAFGANSAAIQAALLALPNLATGDVVVSGAGPYVITFRGTLAGVNVPLVTANGALLTGGTPSATVVLTTTGDIPDGPLLTTINPGDHFHMQLTTVEPPVPGCSCLTYGVAATGATSGIPGTWTPLDSYAPANFALLTVGVVASPGTAWTTGQYVILGDGTHAYWTSTAWAAGEAP